MSGTPYRDDQQLALAVTRFIEDVHRCVPQVRLEPMTPYEDEDFTLAVIIPSRMDEEAVLDQCLAASATIEDEMEVYILPRVQMENSQLLVSEEMGRQERNGMDSTPNPFMNRGVITDPSDFFGRESGDD